MLYLFKEIAIEGRLSILYQVMLCPRRAEARRASPQGALRIMTLWCAGRYLLSGTTKALIFN
jgi:hypothetical protein